MLHERQKETFGKSLREIIESLLLREKKDPYMPGG
jgi:hypothetical protein